MNNERNRDYPLVELISARVHSWTASLHPNLHIETIDAVPATGSVTYDNLK